MVCYQNMMNELADIILENKLQYHDTIIIGNNSSGKSELLKTILFKTDFENWYLIDSVNRYFSAGQIFKMSGEASKAAFSKKIVENRLKEDNYNLRDTFYYMGVPTAIENFYFEFEGKIKELILQFLGVELEVRQSKVGYGVYLDGIESTLSSGYQATTAKEGENEQYKIKTSENSSVLHFVGSRYFSSRIFCRAAARKRRCETWWNAMVRGRSRSLPSGR